MIRITVRYSLGMSDYEITSPSNERIKRLVRLRNRRERAREGVFVVEGPRLVDRALAAGLEPVELYVDGSLDKDYEDALLVAPTALDRASYRQTSQGVLGVFGCWQTGLEELSLSTPALLLVAESLEKPGNLGAMLRTASAVAADALIIVDEGTDPFNPNVVRSSTGAIFDVPFVVTDWNSLKPWLRDMEVSLVAATPQSAPTLWDADLTGSCALLVGSESPGLSREAEDAADILVSIPMRGSVDSLNASVSAALIAYEALRQRS